MHQKLESINKRAKTLAQNYAKLETSLVQIIQQIEIKKIHFQLGYSSLFLYVTEELKLTEATAYNLITVARKCKDFHLFAKAVCSNKISVAKARRIAPIINKQNEQDWIRKAEKMSHRELEKELIRSFPEHNKIKEKTRSLNESEIEVKVTISPDELDKLKLVQDLLSQSQGKPVNMSDALVSAIDFYLSKKDPMRSSPKSRKTKPVAMAKLAKKKPIKSKPKDEELVTLRVQMKKKTIKQVKLRDKNQCTFISKTGKRCGSKRFLDIHHKIPVQFGGTNELKNLQTLCRAHHRLVHDNKRE